VGHEQPRLAGGLEDQERVVPARRTVVEERVRARELPGALEAIVAERPRVGEEDLAQRALVRELPRDGGVEREARGRAGVGRRFGGR
jgi:hypothetical protein